ncbi:heme exporter protein CcmD [uncultured Brevundimonas sp.]|uniref:heme exporter protein CcmD n=1 Tax=uncultured Brevundimonas sp. TaxID=213418 RepID=UPI0030EEC9AA|tara:strand:+ start:74702 stop:74881 length:180 start_codon:yes stop_codon:yes gene_type:complete
MPDLDMGAYAAFVWPAWGLSALVLGILTARAARAARRWTRELKALETPATDRAVEPASE